MNELFIPIYSKPVLGQLTRDFQNASTTVETLNQLLGELKARRRERIGHEDRNLEDKLTCRRQRAYEVAALRVERCTKILFGQTHSLHIAITAVKFALAARDVAVIDFDEEEAIAENNVVCALELIAQAYVLRHDNKNKHLFNCLSYSAINRTYRFYAPDVGRNEREWILNRFEGQGPYPTLAETREEAQRQGGHADTEGGDVLYNLPTK